LIIAQVLMVCYLYQRGLSRLRYRIERGHLFGKWQRYSFWIGITILVIALLSPFDSISKELAYIHMIQHLLIMMIAAPLLVLAAPVMVIICGLPKNWRRIFWRWNRSLENSRWPWPWHWLWQAGFIWLIHALVLWAWHIPWFYVAALRSDLIHYLQHLSFFLVSCFFWRILIDPISRLRANRGLGILYLFTTSLHAAVLGVLMALAQSPWYIDYTVTAPRWGLSAIEDQQLAGLIMWMPACAIYAFAASLLLAVGLRELDLLG